MNSPICIDWQQGPPAFGGRYVYSRWSSNCGLKSLLSGLAATCFAASAPFGRVARPCAGHPCTSVTPVGRRRRPKGLVVATQLSFFLLAVFFGGWAVLGPWAEAHACGAMQTGGLKPLFAVNDMGRWFQPSAHFYCA